MVIMKLRELTVYFGYGTDSLVIVVISKGAPQGVFIKLACLEHSFYYVDLCM